MGSICDAHPGSLLYRQPMKKHATLTVSKYSKFRLNPLKQ